jgi:hypothetical protein
MEPETVYVAKVARLEDLEGKKGLTWQAVWAVIALSGVFGFALGGATATLMGKDFMLGVGSGLLVAGILLGLVGHFWLLFEAFQDSMAWFGAILISTNFGWSSYIFIGPLGFALTPILSIVYGAINWSNAKYPLVVGLIGNFVFAPIGIAVLLFAIGPEFLGFGGGEAAAAAQ